MALFSILINLRALTISAIFWLCASTAFAATYYIDFDNGNDTNSGLTRTSALKTIPGTVTSSTIDTSTITYLNSSWGPFSTASKVPPGTVFKLKRGTAYSIQDGGYIWIRSDHYQPATASNPIKFEADLEWGTGPVTFDGQGMSIPIALFIIQNDGINFDGKSPGGIDIRNSTNEGVQVKEYPSGLAVQDCAFKNMKFFNNGTSFRSDSAGSGAGQLNLRKVTGCLVDLVEFDGNKSATPLHYINGLLAGDNYKTVQNLVVSNSSAHDHLGDPEDNDSGIGFKVLNGQATFKNITSYNNLKGFDLGEQGSNGFDPLG